MNALKLLLKKTKAISATIYLNSRSKLNAKLKRSFVKYNKTPIIIAKELLIKKEMMKIIWLVFRYFGRTIASSSLKLATTVKMETMLIINANPPKYSGEYNLDNKGAVIIVNSCAIAVPKSKIDTLVKNVFLIKNRLNISEKEVNFYLFQ